jgi:uncharacterized protein
MRKAITTMFIALALGCAPEADSIGQTGAALHGGAPMRIYIPGQPVPQSELQDLGDPANLGGEVLEGDPRIAARVDFAGNGLVGGVFQGTKGVVRITFPFTEHATIIHGKVKITDESGQSHTFEEGDSYIIQQGSVVLWEVNVPYVQKSFLNYTLAP